MQNSNNRSRSSSDHYFHKLDMLMTKPLASAKLPGKDKKKHITYHSITYFLFVLVFFFLDLSSCWCKFLTHIQIQLKPETSTTGFKCSNKGHIRTMKKLSFCYVDRATV